MAFALRPGILLAETEYGMALLDQKSGEYWTLNPTAALVLQTVLDGKTTRQAVAALTGRYDVTADLAEQDVERILGELHAADLVAAP